MSTYAPTEKRTPDAQYQELLRTIMEDGRKVNPIQDESARMISGYELRYEIKNGFPVIPERDLSGRFFRGALGEHIGFLNGARTHEELKEYGCPWWERWVTEEKCDIFGLEKGDLGPGSYGAAWTSFPTAEGYSVNQIKNVVEQINNRPNSRTHLISPWIPQYVVPGEKNDRKVVVAPCHGWIHVHVFPEKETFRIVHWQRSADVPVGLAFNIIQYAAFGLMLESVTGFEMESLIHQISDAHIYANQFEKVEEILSREERRLPTVTIKNEKESIFDYRPGDFRLEDYNPHEKMIISTPI